MSVLKEKSYVFAVREFVKFNIPAFIIEQT